MNFLLAVVVSLPSSSSLVQDDESRRRAGDLIQRLDSDVIKERERALEDLVADFDRFEQAVKEAAEKGAPEVRARCQEILRQSAVARQRKDSWSPARPIRLSVKASPLREVVKQLGEASGYQIRLDPGSSDQPISINLDRMSFLEALGSLCRAAGLWYTRARDGSFTLSPGKPPASSPSYVGPLVLSGTLSGLDKPQEIRRVALSINWEPRIKPRWFDVRVESAEDDHGESVALNPDRSSGSDITHTWRFHNYPRQEAFADPVMEVVPLASPLKPGAKLRSLKGKITLYFPQEVSKLHIDVPPTGEKQQMGVVTASLDELRFERECWSSRFELDTSRVPREERTALYAIFNMTPVRFIDRNGDAHPTEQKGGGSGGHVTDPLQRMSVWIYTVPLKSPLAAIEADIVTRVWEKTYSFELKDVGSSGDSK